MFINVSNTKKIVLESNRRALNRKSPNGSQRKLALDVMQGLLIFPMAVGPTLTYTSYLVKFYEDDSSLQIYHRGNNPFTLRKVTVYFFVTSETRK